MNCPKCQSAMEIVTTPAGSVDRCSACKGMWFDRLEAKAQAGFADRIDTGDASKGAELNKADRIFCPVCANTPLTRMVDTEQHHIWFEACPSCNGRFFDAGEFADLSEHSVMDVLRGWRTPDRGA